MKKKVQDIPNKGPYAHIPPSWHLSLSPGSDGAVPVSVNMIVKNEAPRLARALASLIPLRPSEVIVGDTGSTDESREVARWFGCRVIEIPWNDHFSDARNAVLDASAHEWIVWIDGDEQFADNSARKLRRKIENDELKASYQIFTYTEYPFVLHQSRMFRNSPSIRWKGRVHEQVWPDGDVQDHNDIVVIQHPDERRPDKYRRNIDLLEKAMEDEPMSPYFKLHAAILHNIVGDHTKAEMFAHQFLRLSSREDLRPRVYIMYLLAWTELFHKRNVQRCVELAASGLAMDISAAELWCLIGDAYWWAGRQQDSIAFYENAIAFGKSTSGTFWLTDMSKYDEYPAKQIDKLTKAGVKRPDRVKMVFGPDLP